MPPLCLELIKGLFTLAAVGLGAYVALRTYFRQKEYELVKQRYLEGGVDLVAAELESALGVVSHNWSRCLQICRSFRDGGEDFDVKELERGFLDLDTSKFQRVAHHRIGSLIGSQIIWEAFQDAMAYASLANGMFTEEIPQAIRIRCTTTRIDKDHATMANTMMEASRKRHDCGSKYASLLRELHALGLMLEAEKLNLKAIAMFSKRPAVAQLIQRLQTQLPAPGTHE